MLALPAISTQLETTFVTPELENFPRIRLLATMAEPDDDAPSAVPAVPFSLYACGPIVVSTTRVCLYTLELSA